jgi:ketosteroid isomerase-like protein
MADSANLHREPTIMPTRDKNVTRLMRLALLAIATAAPMMPAASLASQPSQSSDAGTPAELAEAVSAYRQATMRGDTATLSDLVADDYILINSDSSLQGKPSYLADFKLPGFKVDRYVVEQPVYKVWGDTALVRSLLHMGWTQDGKQHSRVLRIAHVWTRRDGHWQIAYTQLTRVPDR